jgi:hypothetical protein
MVDVQTVGVLVTATSVTVAAIYYIINLRETAKNRRVALTTSLMQSFISEEGSKRWMELINMKWSDYDDFEEKYGSRTNLDNFAKRNTVWRTCEILGYQYRQGLIDFGTLYAICNNAVPITWVKFKSVLDEQMKRGYSPKDTYDNFEYLAFEISKKMEKIDPNFRASGAFKPDEYYEAFGRSKPA